MSSQEVLDRLLETWRARWLADNETLPEGLCRDTPELLDELKRNIAQIKLLDELIGEYEEQQQAGKHPTPEAICLEHPELLERFKEEIQKLALFDSVFGETENEAEAKPVDVGPFCGGRYDIQGVLNRGGQGIIYTAQDQELGRTVVVKGPGQRGLGREALGRLEQEAHTTGRLEHPGVVPVYGFGRDKEGKPYYAMKFIDGETLGVAIKHYHAAGASLGEPGNKPVEFQKLLRDFVLVCQTIAYAHSRGIVHRDIKPINIMLGKFGEVWVVDWGLAKRPADKTNGHESAAPSPLPAALSWRSQWMSQTYSLKGTLMYMSPEQAEGRNNDVGPLSDVYSLGATFYELLTGRPPVLGNTPAEIMERVIAGNVSPCRVAKADVPPALEAICMKALGRLPQDRYAGAAELADDLERWLADEPVAAWPEPITARAGRWVRRHRTLVTGAVAALLVGVVGLGLLATQQAWAKKAVNDKNLQLNKANDGLNKANDELNKANDELKKANQREKAAAELARLNELEAKKQEKLAKEREQAERIAKEETRKLLYFSRIGLARSEWLAGNIRRTRQLLETCDADLRGWEWRFLIRLCDAELKKLSADWPVTCLARSQDGRIIAAGRWDGTIATWAELLKRGEHMRIPKDISFRPEGDISSLMRFEVAAISVSPNGKLIAAASHRQGGEPILGGAQRSEVRVWEAVSGKPVFTLPIPADAVVFSPDGATLAVATGKSVELWEVATQKKTRTFEVKDALRRCLAYSADGQFLASGGMDGIVKVWSLKLAADQPAEFSLDASGVILSVSLSADGQRLAAGNTSGVIDLWNLQALRAKDMAAQTHMTLVGHTAQVRSLAFHPLRPLLASGSNDRTVKIWKADAGQEYQTLRGHEDLVTGVLFGPGGNELLSASQDGTVKFWDPIGGQEAPGYLGQTFGASATGGRLATTWMARPYPQAEGAKAVWVWDLATGKEQRAFEGHTGEVSCVALSRDGKLAASGSGRLSGGEAIIWEVETGKTVWKLESSEGDIKRAAFSPDGLVLATASAGSSFSKTTGDVKFWNVKTGKLILTAIALAAEPTNLVFSPDGKLVAVSTRSGPVRLLDAKTGEEVLVLKQHAYSGIAFSHDGKLLATTGGSETKGGHVWVWSTDTGELAYEIAGHSDEITAAAFSPHGERIATGGADATVRIWDAALRQEIISLPHPNRVNQLEFVGDDLISSSGDFLSGGYTKHWKAPQHELKK